MREIDLNEITKRVKELFLEANIVLPEDVKQALVEGAQKEESPVGKEIFDDILKNAELAKQEQMPICQDTGFAVVLIEIGQEVHFVGNGTLYEAINKGVREAYTEGYFRASILADPVRRTPNTKDNTPAVIWVDIVPGDKVKIMAAPKGGGSENMSKIAMLKPADGVEGLKRFVVKAVEEAGSNPCPPIVVGVGVGGTFEKCAFLAKKALFRKIGEHNPDPFYAQLETELLEEINNTGVGPMGLGGRITALAVNIEPYPCHIASFPVAVNINCHAARHKEAII